MKNFITFLILSLVFAVSNLPAQETVRVETPTITDATPDSTVTAALTYTPSPKVYRNTGMVGFQYTYTAGAADSATGTIYGSVDGSNWVIAGTQARSAAGTYLVKEDTPDFIYYKFVITPGTGDSVFVQKVNFIYKEK